MEHKGYLHRSIVNVTVFLRVLNDDACWFYSLALYAYANCLNASFAPSKPSECLIWSLYYVTGSNNWNYNIIIICSPAPATAWNRPPFASNSPDLIRLFYVIQPQMWTPSFWLCPVQTAIFYKILSGPCFLFNKLIGEDQNFF